MLAMGLKKLEAKKIVICKIKYQWTSDLWTIYGVLAKDDPGLAACRNARGGRGCKYKDRTLIGALLGEG